MAGSIQRGVDESGPSLGMARLRIAKCERNGAHSAGATARVEVCRCVVDCHDVFIQAPDDVRRNVILHRPECGYNSCTTGTEKSSAESNNLIRHA
jgi:hypothetical protein